MYHYEAKGRDILLVTEQTSRVVSRWADAALAASRADEYNRARPDTSEWEDCPVCGGIIGMDGGGRCVCDDGD